MDLENTPFVPEAIWKQALLRYMRNVNATSYHASETVTRWLGRGNRLANAPIKHLRKYLYPLSSLNQFGRLEWTKTMQNEFKRNKINYNGVAAASNTAGPGPS